MAATAHRQQNSFYVAFALDGVAPAYIFGIGYSFRLDGLIKR